MRSWPALLSDHVQYGETDRKTGFYALLSRKLAAKGRRWLDDRAWAALGALMDCRDPLDGEGPVAPRLLALQSLAYHGLIDANLRLTGAAVDLLMRREAA